MELTGAKRVRDDAAAARVPVYPVESIIVFSGSAAEKRAELRAGEDEPAPAELSTVAATVAAGLRHSLRTIAEATVLVRTSTVWTDWSPMARDLRNRQAGQRKLGL